MTDLKCPTTRRGALGNSLKKVALRSEARPVQILAMRMGAFVCLLLACLSLPVSGGDARSPASFLTNAPVGSAWNDHRNPIRKLWSGGRLDLWSLRPTTLQKPPPISNTSAEDVSKVQPNPIDGFIRARQAALELPTASPATVADRRTLFRRLSFGLTGLPPSFEDVQTFETDVRPDAYQRVVDRLLASPRYGEHQARLWLDVIRYSDSNGFDWDEFRKQAWRFRDYAIRSFNADKPFDQFICEQLAGDELLEGAPRIEAEQDCLIATGYLRLGPHDSAAPLFNEQDRSRAELLSDLVETTGSAFLGLTLSCCRCHDHKTEPLSQEDHYRMRAFFEGVRFADSLPLDLAGDQESIRQHNASVDAQITPLDSERQTLLETTRARLRRERVGRLTADEQALLSLPKEVRNQTNKERIASLEKQVQPSDSDVAGALNPSEKQRIADIDKQLTGLRRQHRAFTHGLLMTDVEGPIPATQVLFQGNHQSPRQEVTPGFLSALDPAPAELQRPPNPKTSGRRLTLARWIASPSNPLTARVLVNRIWQQHFGRGLVETPNDFGHSGARPAHPDLLDWLADEFMRSGWSVKSLHRRILTSATYRQNSMASDRHGKLPEITVASPRPQVESQTLDADNLLLRRQNPSRLSAEQLRDALLAVSGRLNDRSSGTPVWPELPSEILTANPAFLDDNETKTKGWYPSPPEQLGARSVFLVQKRTVRVPFMETFDLPENSTSCARRTDSTVAPQALTLLNSPLAADSARAFAKRAQREAGPEPAAQIRRVFQLAFQRHPSAEEHQRCESFLEDRTLAELCRAMLNLNEFVYLD